MGTDKLSGQPDKMLREGWVDLQGTIPSQEEYVAIHRVAVWTF